VTGWVGWRRKGDWRDSRRQGLGRSLETKKLPPRGTLSICSSLGFWFLFVCLFRATPMAYGVSQARGPIGAVATGEDLATPGT